MRTAFRRSALLLPAALALFAFPSALWAHRLDEYLQATLVDIEPSGIQLQINLTPGVAIAEKVLALLDTGHDGTISAKEAAAYAELLKHDLDVRLDGRKAELTLTASDFPPPDELRTGFGIIQMEFLLPPESLTTGAHKLRFENRHLSTVSVYLVNAALPKAGSIQITRQTRNENQSTSEIDFTFHPPRSHPGALGIVAIFAALFAAFEILRKTRPTACIPSGAFPFTP